MNASRPSSDFEEEGSIFFSGTATVVIRFAGFTLLTDPNFLHRGDRAHLGYGLTSRRRTEPALSVEEANGLPFDAVILSHLHGDHFDQIAEKRLNKAFPIVTTPHAAGKLARKGFTTHALATWRMMTLTKGDVRLDITSLPGKHGPGVLDRLLPPTMGSLLEFHLPSDRVLRIYISGDTLVFEGLYEIPKTYPSIDLGLMHLGGAHILGVMLTMDADEGIHAVRIINPRRIIPIHYDDYEVFKSPLEDFKAAVKTAGIEERVTHLGRGETFRFLVKQPEMAVSI